MANTWFINCNAMIKINFLKIGSNQHWLLHESDGNSLSLIQEVHTPYRHARGNVGLCSIIACFRDYETILNLWGLAPWCGRTIANAVFWFFFYLMRASYPSLLHIANYRHEIFAMCSCGDKWMPTVHSIRLQLQIYSCTVIHCIWRQINFYHISLHSNMHKIKVVFTEVIFLVHTKNLLYNGLFLKSQ
jgi:hypothetical protein